MGQKSVEYVNLGQRGAGNFNQYLPQTFNKEEFAKDIALVAQLWELSVPLASLLESIDDTMLAASVKALVSEMAKRFAKQSRAPKKKNPKPESEIITRVL